MRSRPRPSLDCFIHRIGWEGDSDLRTSGVTVDVEDPALNHRRLLRKVVRRRVDLLEAETGRFAMRGLTSVNSICNGPH
jgi:hypothetical protein